MGSGGGDRRHRGQGGAVEQTDDDQSEADRAQPGGLLAGAAADNRDADRLVEASRESDCTKCRMVSVAAASAPEMKTALMPMRNLREPARRRAIPIRGDIGNSARRIMTRMRDYFRGRGRERDAGCN